MATKVIIGRLAKDLDMAYAERAISELTTLRDELQERYDNLSERATESERGQAMSERLNKLDEAVKYAEALQTAYEDLDGAMAEIINGEG